MAGLSLVSLNVERAKRLNTVLPFLAKRKPDITCLQEVRAVDVPQIATILGAVATHYVPMTRQHELSGEINEHGVCIFSRHPIQNSSARYYVGDASHLPDSDERIVESWTSGQNRVLALCDVSANAMYRIGTTHFTWSERGETSELQRRDIYALLALLKSEPELVLCGDFNAPRGGEIFSTLAQKYKDNVPAFYKTSIDLNLHRAAKERRHELESKMVDGLFTTPMFSAYDVKLQCGVSDHCAVVATIDKKRV